jgi:nitronate monooxygenase
MAPMFLVSNEEMMKSAMRFGILGTFPTLNYRKENELQDLIANLHKFKKENNAQGTFGVNLIVQKTNPLYEKHLKICVEGKVPFYITSLGNPKEVIDKAHSYGGKVFCDVTNLEHAQKCASLGCDGFIAVCQGAGGHAGPYPFSVLIPALRKEFPTIPVIAAGGIANGAGILSALAAGAEGVSMGTRFIATHEAGVSNEYKQSIVDSGMENIVLTDRLSGTPCAIINTPYAQKIGTKQNAFEKWMSNNSTTRKYFKMLIQVQGMKKLEEAIKPGNYNNLWSAGQSVELIDDILSCEEVLSRLEKEITISFEQLTKQIK